MYVLNALHIQFLVVTNLVKWVYLSDKSRFGDEDFVVITEVS